jgi:opacity protein-like surface antigen
VARLGKHTFGVKMKCICIAFIFVLVTFNSARSETVFVEPLLGSGVSESDLKTISELVRVSTSEMENYEVIDTDQNSAQIVLKGKVLKLGESYIISLMKYVNGQKVFASKMKATNMEDIDSVSSRLVRAVLTDVRVEKDARVSDLTQSEANAGTLRREALRQWEIGFGPAFPSGLNSRGSGTNWRFGYVWGIDPQVDLRFGWEFLSVKDYGDVNYTDAHIGLNYYLSDANISPYITGDVGYGAATAHRESNNAFFGSSDDASGFVLGFGGGFKFFRISNVNLGLQLRYSRILEKTKLTKESPSVTNLNLSVYF